MGLSCSDSDMVELLRSMEELLRTTHEYDHVNDLEKLIETLQKDLDQAFSVLTSNTFWGGAGSFMDLWLSPANRNVSDDFDRDNRLLHVLLLRLLRCLKSRGYIWLRQEFQEDYLRNLTNRSG